MKLIRSLLVALLALTPVQAFAQSATINLTDVRQLIDGFGAANAPQGLDAAKADLFFSQSGIWLSLMRLPFASNGPGPSPYFPETTTFYADAAFAAARGVKVWAAPWTAMNTTWKDNASLVQGHLLSAHFGDFATFQSGLQADLVANSGPKLYGMSVLNEPDIADGAVAYESMQMSAADMVTYIKNNLGPSLAALSPRPKLIAPECSNWDNSGTYLSTLLADSTAAGFIDIVATHQYSGTVQALTTTKHVWQTEMSGLSGTFDASMTSGLALGAEVHAALLANVNAWHAWWTRGSQGNDLGLIGTNSDDTITKRLYVLGNYSKFIRPNASRVGVTTASLTNVDVSAYRNVGNGSVVVVATNHSGASVSPVITFSTDLTVASVTPWLTDATHNLVAQAPITVTSNAFTPTLANSTVTTFVGTLSSPARYRKIRVR